MVQPTKFKIDDETEEWPMKARRFGSFLMLLAVVCISCGLSAAQRRNIDRWERRELRADRREIRADNGELRGDRRDIHSDIVDRRGDVREFREDRREGGRMEDIR